MRNGLYKDMGAFYWQKRTELRISTGADCMKFYPRMRLII